MQDAEKLLNQAYALLASQPGFQTRENQIQLSRLVSDCIHEKRTGIFEAPTGLGKSLGVLLPAIANAITHKRRVVIATYTNVLAEQYWRKDLPLALQLFEDHGLKSQFLIGRQRYACLSEMALNMPQFANSFSRTAELGIESEFRQLIPIPRTELSKAWQTIAVPPICASRLCDHYNQCFYYRARRATETADIVITNHSVVLQDALLKRTTDGEVTMLGKYDFLIIDEAHDFPQAAMNALEFTLSESRLNMLIGLVNKIDQSLIEPAQIAGEIKLWRQIRDQFVLQVELLSRQLNAYAHSLSKPGILETSPAEIGTDPRVNEAASASEKEVAREITDAVAQLTDRFAVDIRKLIDRIRYSGKLQESTLDKLVEATHHYVIYIQQFGVGSGYIFHPTGVSVSSVSKPFSGPELRHDVIGLAEPLQDLLWNRVPSVSVSATLAVDDSFEFYKEMTGVDPVFEESLPSPFDFERQAALYLPPEGLIPDPTIARRENLENQYYSAVASEVSRIINLMQGRTLVLCHSRREMEEVFARLNVHPDLPVYMQKGSAVSSIAEKFKRNVSSSLLAVRSFWTGFDAPGETLSCVILLRVPFEVPVEPAQITRNAWISMQQRDPFASYSLPMAKMMVRQGIGRLIRTDQDRGLIVLLDPRLRTKKYGSSILENLPPEMRTYSDLEDAVGWLGLA